MISPLDFARACARRRLVALGISAFGVVWMAGVFAVDHVLSRPDRIAAEKAEVEMIVVGDGLLLYEHERGELPDSLDAMVPQYVREDQIIAGERPIYAYDVRARALVQREGWRVKGIFRRTLEPKRIVIPPRDRPISAASTASAEPEAARPGIPPLLSREGPARETLHPIVLAAMPEYLPPDAFRAGLARIPRGPDLPDPPAGAIVFEAELFSETNYGWEVREDAESAAGAYLHAKEGIANGPGQQQNRMGHFYDVQATRDHTYLRYHFNLPAAGSYYIYGLFMSSNTKCSNYINVGIDRGGPGIGSMGNRTPFRWRWTDINDRSRGPMRLSAGDHFFHLFIHEDGVRIDQFILSPTPIPEEAGPFRANYAPGRGTDWRRGEGPPVHLSTDVETMIIARDSFPRVNVVMRRLRDAVGVGTLRIFLEDAAPGGGDAALVAARVDLAALPELTLVPADFSRLDPSRLARREYLLRATIEDSEGATIASARVPLWRHWDWRYFGPGKFLTITQPGPMDGTAEMDDRPAEWKPFETANYEHFGVMDFGLQISGNSRNPREFATVYAETMIEVPEAGEYLFKMMADDQMLLWLNGEPIYRHPYTAPVTRAAHKFKRKLDAGRHTLRFRLNNYRDVWQTYMRVRTLDDEVSGVFGLDWAEESAASDAEAAEHQVEPRQ